LTRARPPPRRAWRPLVERLAAQIGGEPASRVLIERRLGDDAGPAQHVAHAQGRGLRHFLQYLQRELAQPRERLGVHARAGREGGRVVVEDPAIDLAARDARDDQLAQHGLGGAHLVGDAKLQVEKARIDRAQLHREPAARRVGRGSGEAGHALDHSLS